MALRWWRIEIFLYRRLHRAVRIREHTGARCLLHCGLKQDVKGRTIAFHCPMRRVLPSECADCSRDVSIDPDHLWTSNSLTRQDLSLVILIYKSRTMFWKQTSPSQLAIQRRCGTLLGNCYTAHQHTHWAMKTVLWCRADSVNSSPIWLLVSNRKSLISLKQWTKTCSRCQGYTPALHSSPSQTFHQPMCQRCWARCRTSLHVVTYFRHRCWNRVLTCSLHWLPISLIAHSQRAHSRCLRRLRCFHCWRNQAETEPIQAPIALRPT